MVRYDEPNLRLVRSIVDSINTMAAMLYEIKAGTPLGRKLNTLLNLCRRNGKGSIEGLVKLAGITFCAMANTTEISEVELIKALDYLRQRGIITSGPASGKRC